ncbi:PBSX family phage terminase large subunit [Carnobacterium maltaromaticum]|uniref:PBSX family phage terminase large subunit n=1 Tax=Carnobacterium maltaromaticum TaxID=2751 RepID=UPI000713B859|nr:PBSX family phage terminase large subunit [Carnobacterium maltaromaticum]KRN61630.1 phage terminase, large subunit, PBSX family [Carnobacterium maltaromaticum DSM 20342]
MNKVVVIQNEINPHFKPVWTTEKPYNILKGGRNSFKSSVIALLLVYMMISYLVTGKKANVVVIRKVASNIRDSVYLKIQWALSKFGIMDQFTCTVSPFRVTHKKTGSTFFFYGQDDFQKLKSNDIGNIISVWYEEAAEFKNAEEFDQSNTTFMRQKHPDADMVRFFWSYNPPRNPYSWINEWVESLKGLSNYLVNESSYLNDELGFVTQQMLDDIERIKKNDYDYYRYLYLGEPVGLGTNVYNIDLFQALEELPTDDRITSLYYATDVGHQTSATVCLAFGLTAKGKVILLNMYYYSPQGKAVKKAPSDLSKDLYEFVKKTANHPSVGNAQVRQRTIDSAEGGLRNQYYKDYGQRWHPVAKKKNIDMIDYVHDLLAQGRFYYLVPTIKTGLSNCDDLTLFVEEHKRYQFKETTLNSDNPDVIKEFDHSVDAFKYGCIDNAREWKLKV